MSASTKQIEAETHRKIEGEAARQIRFADDKVVEKSHFWAIRKFAAMFRILAK
jgi:hypothetical protein